MTTSGKTKQSRLEKLIGNKIKKAKPKHEKPGYIKQLVLNQFELIEGALDRGCDFDDLADVISGEIGREVSANTLKRYHLANRRTLLRDSNGNEDHKHDENDHRVSSTKDDSISSKRGKKVETTPKINFFEQNKNELEFRDTPSEKNEKTSLEDRLRNSSLDSDLFGEDEDEDLSGYNIY